MLGSLGGSIGARGYGNIYVSKAGKVNRTEPETLAPASVLVPALADTKSMMMKSRKKTDRPGERKSQEKWQAQTTHKLKTRIRRMHMNG
jgi:hypothetical protein